MKRNQIIILLGLSLSTLLITSCNQTTDPEETPKENLDSLGTNKEEPEVKEEINLVNTLDFTLTAQDKLILEAFENTTTPETFIVPEEDQLKTTEQLFKFYTEQEIYWWEAVSALEKDKLLSVDRLIQEMSLNPKCNSEKLNEVKKYSQKLKTLFLQREDIADQSKIVYDDFNGALIDTIISIGNNVEDMEGYLTYKNMRQDILKLNGNEIIQYRNAHAQSITQRNQFITENKDELKKLGLNTTPSEEWAVPE